MSGNISKLLNKGDVCSLGHAFAIMRIGFFGPTIRGFRWVYNDDDEEEEGEEEEVDDDDDNNNC